MKSGRYIQLTEDGTYPAAFNTNAVNISLRESTLLIKRSES